MFLYTPGTSSIPADRSVTWRSLSNFFTADQDAAAQDVWDLVRAVRKRVFESTGVLLTPEIRFAGAFEESGEEPTGPETAE